MDHPPFHKTRMGEKFICKCAVKQRDGPTI